MVTQDQLKIHYELEKKLAAKIMDAPPSERAAISLAVYDELFRVITWHDGNLESSAQKEQLETTYAPFARLIGQGYDVLEVGCGNGIQMRKLAARNKRCVGIDISAEVLDFTSEMPDNVELMIADAVDLKVIEDDAFDVAFSSQLIEHLHPEDLPRHFGEISRVLRPGGRYVLETPHRLTGPHDVSAHFDEVATCFHLKEYFFGELIDMMRDAGFKKFRSPLFRNKMYKRMPAVARGTEFPADWKRPLEFMLSCLPLALRRKMAHAARLNTIIIEATN